MAFIPIPNAVKVTIEFTLAGQTVVLTFTVSKGSPFSGADLISVANIFESWRDTNLRTLQSNTCVGSRIVVVDLSSQFAPSYELPIVTNAAGTATGDAYPNNVANVVSLLTTLRGRAFRGRSYMVGMAESWGSGSSILVVTATLLANTYNALQTSLTGSGMSLAVGSRQLNGVPRAIGVATPVSSFRVDTILDSQRRRLPGRGR